MFTDKKEKNVFTTKDMVMIVNFMGMIKEKGLTVFLEVVDGMGFVDGLGFSLNVEFRVDEEYVIDLCKDWIIFHSDLVKNYSISKSGNEVLFTIYISERSL